MLYRETKRDHVISTDFSDQNQDDCISSYVNLFLLERGIVNCNIDMAGAIFQHLFSNLSPSITLNPMNRNSRDWEQKKVLREFSQKEFLPDDLELF